MHHPEELLTSDGGRGHGVRLSVACQIRPLTPRISIRHFFFWLAGEGQMHNLKYDYTFRRKLSLEPPPVP
jgi:hypothetical protein